MQAMGAYFGTASIDQGAAGLGQEDGPLMAFADGSIGVGPVEQQMPGPLQAYRDGSLGWYDQAAHGIGAEDAPEASDVTLASYHDGIFGGHFEDSDMPVAGRLMAYHDGSLGAYARAMGAAAQNVLDLSSPPVLREVKGLMALLAPEAALCAACTQLYTPEFYTSGIWEPESSLLWQHVRDKAPRGQNINADAGDQVYPNAAGIGWMAATIGAPTASAYGPAYLASSFPLVSAWFRAGGGTVIPPFLSITDKAKGVVGGGGTTRMSSVAMLGLGAVALLGLALVFRR